MKIVKFPPNLNRLKGKVVMKPNVYTIVHSPAGKIRR